MVDWSKHVGPCPIFIYGADGRSILFAANAKMAVIGILSSELGEVTGV